MSLSGSDKTARTAVYNGRLPRSPNRLCKGSGSRQRSSHETSPGPCGIYKVKERGSSPGPTPVHPLRRVQSYTSNPSAITRALPHRCWACKCPARDLPRTSWSNVLMLTQIALSVGKEDPHPLQKRSVSGPTGSAPTAPGAGHRSARHTLPVSPSPPHRVSSPFTTDIKTPSPGPRRRREGGFLPAAPHFGTSENLGRREPESTGAMGKVPSCRSELAPRMGAQGPRNTVGDPSEQQAPTLLWTPLLSAPALGFGSRSKVPKPSYTFSHSDSPNSG